MKRVKHYNLDAIIAVEWLLEEIREMLFHPQQLKGIPAGHFHKRIILCYNEIKGLSCVTMKSKDYPALQ